MEQRTTEWHTARKGRVTGSIAGAILGLAPYMTREDALRSMVRAYHGAEREFTGNIATEYGTNNEADAIECFSLKTGIEVTPCGFYAYEDWLGASPDGVCNDGNGLEVKCPYGKRHSADFKSIADQPHYYAQMQLEILCADFKGMWFYQWSAHGDKLEYVAKDQEWLDINLPILRQFYALYLSELDNPEHLEPLRKEINTPQAKMMIDEIGQLSEAIDNATARKKELMESLVKEAGEQNALIWGHKLTKVEKEGSVKYAEVVKKHLPELDLTPYKGKSSSFWKLS